MALSLTLVSQKENAQVKLFRPPATLLLRQSAKITIRLHIQSGLHNMTTKSATRDVRDFSEVTLRGYGDIVDSV